MSIRQKLNKSPISYFSDLFVVVMVVGWMTVLVIMTASAVYAMVALADTSVWSYVTEAVTIPLSAGGAIWMVKNSVQHAIAYSRGERAHEDFPAVDASETIDGQEEPFSMAGTAESEETEGDCG